MFYICLFFIKLLFLKSKDGLTKLGELQNEFIRSDMIQFFDNGTCSSIVWEKKYTYVNGQILLDQENHEEIPCD